MEKNPSKWRFGAGGFSINDPSGVNLASPNQDFLADFWGVP